MLAGGIKLGSAITCMIYTHTHAYRDRCKQQVSRVEFVTYRRQHKGEVTGVSRHERSARLDVIPDQREHLEYL